MDTFLFVFETDVSSDIHSLSKYIMFYKMFVYIEKKIITQWCRKISLNKSLKQINITI